MISVCFSVIENSVGTLLIAHSCGAAWRSIRLERARNEGVFSWQSMEYACHSKGYLRRVENTCADAKEVQTRSPSSPARAPSTPSM
jgi:hypothetical protein